MDVQPAAGGHELAEEFFSPVLGVTELPGRPADFVRAAVKVTNEHFAGTLGVNLIVDLAIQRIMGDDLETAIADLRYGLIAINASTGVGYLTERANWGAFPGQTIDDVQSGIGGLHNAALLDDTERTVVRGPFRPAPRSFRKGNSHLLQTHRGSPATARPPPPGGC